MARQQWVLDPKLSGVSFSIPNIPGHKVRGRFDRWAGTLDMEAAGFEDAHVELTIDPSSICTGDCETEREAISQHFFDVGHYPAIVFESTDVIIDGDQAEIVGILTLHGVSRPIRAQASYVGHAPDLEGNERISWESHMAIKRSEFGLRWHPALEDASGIVIGDTVEIETDLEFVREA
jgi:polyisoprenoid-binding protein YceI